MTTLFDTLLADRLATDPAAPLLTHYDAAEDSRIELSAVTLTNWAAKIAGLLRDELGAVPGDTVVADLAPHWLSVAVCGGIWWSGCQLALDDGHHADPLATVCTEDRLSALLDSDADPLYVAGLDAFAMAPLDLPPGVENLVGAARIHPDAYTPGGGAAQPLAWTTVADVIAAGAEPAGGAEPADPTDPTGEAGDAGAPGGRRVLCTSEPDTRELAELAVRTLAAGDSLVLVTGLAARFGDDTAARTAYVDRIRAAEKID